MDFGTKITTETSPIPLSDGPSKTLFLCGRKKGVRVTILTSSSNLREQFDNFRDLSKYDVIEISRSSR